MKYRSSTSCGLPMSACGSNGTFLKIWNHPSVMLTICPAFVSNNWKWNLVAAKSWCSKIRSNAGDGEHQWFCEFLLPTVVRLSWSTFIHGVCAQQEGSRDLQKGYPSVTKGASSSAKHPSKVPFTKAWRGLHLRKASKGLEEIWRELEGSFKRLQGGLKGASRGLEAGLKPSTLKGASRRLEGGLKGASRGFEGGLTLKGA